MDEPQVQSDREGEEKEPFTAPAGNRTLVIQEDGRIILK
jgi:hypothetical protein